MVITEALAELKTIGKRIEKKQQFVGQYACRQTHMVDPFTKDGGTPNVLARELQAISDLEEFYVVLRRAIAKANAETKITIGKATRSIADWLVYRKEIAERRQRFVTTILAGIQANRAKAHASGLSTVTDERESTKPGDVVVNLDEMALNLEVEAMDDVLGKLDGMLSLKNATVLVVVE